MRRSVQAQQSGVSSAMRPLVPPRGPLRSPPHLPAASMRAAVVRPLPASSTRSRARREEDRRFSGAGADADAPTETRLISRAEGYYWVDDEAGADGAGREVGPFASIEAALADRGGGVDVGEDDAGEAGDAGLPAWLAEVEDELGMASWIDPETGAPAEATWTRLEDH